MDNTSSENEFERHYNKLNKYEKDFFDSAALDNERLRTLNFKLKEENEKLQKIIEEYESKALSGDYAINVYDQLLEKAKEEALKGFFTDLPNIESKFYTAHTNFSRLEKRILLKINGKDITFVFEDRETVESIAFQIAKKFMLEVILNKVELSQFEKEMFGYERTFNEIEHGVFAMSGFVPWNVERKC